MIKRKNIELALIFGLVFSIVFSFAKFESSCENLKSNILRLHIIANSDSDIDQQLKLKVRDAVLEETKNDFIRGNNLSDAVNIAKENIEKINKTANKVIKENGFSYKADTTVKKEYFSTRVYDSFTLPAGKYTSLSIRLGNAKGHNWWCVIYPTVCLPSAAENETLKNSVNESAAEIAYNPQKYVIKFKTAEIYEKIKKNFKK